MTTCNWWPMFSPKMERSSLTSRLQFVGLLSGGKFDSWVFKDNRRVNSDHLSSVAKLIPVVEELAILDVLCLSNSETSMAGNKDLFSRAKAH
ncbi:hypothetical protein ACOSQ2_011013 [Xanthoceras sorbifolium]